MARERTKGKCRFCNVEYTKAGMTKHLETCKARLALLEDKGATKPLPTFHLVAEGYDAPEYWLQLDVPTQLTLSDLDAFLRDIWLECCGHLSAFSIDGQEYASSAAGEMGMKSMRAAKLANVLHPGQKLGYEYDFGTTTALLLTVVSEHVGVGKPKTIDVQARNEPPTTVCQTCGKPATKVCSICIIEQDSGFCCAKCAKGHECGEDMFLPVVNSPRMGMCGYEG